MTVIRWLRQSLRTCPFDHIRRIMFRFSSLIVLPLFFLLTHFTYIWHIGVNATIKFYMYLFIRPLSMDHVCFRIAEWSSSEGNISADIFMMRSASSMSMTQTFTKSNTLKSRSACQWLTDLKVLSSCEQSS